MYVVKMSDFIPSLIARDHDLGRVLSARGLEEKRSVSCVAYRNIATYCLNIRMIFENAGYQY
jgi:hypothetical protein